MIYLTFVLIFVALLIPAFISYLQQDIDHLNLLITLIINTTLIFATVYLIMRYGFNRNLFSPTVFNLKFFLGVIFITAIMELIFGLLSHFFNLSARFSVIHIESFSLKKFIQSFLLALLSSLAFLLHQASFWTTATFGLLNPEQLLYNLQQPMEGTNTSFVSSFLNGPLLQSIASFVLLLPLLLIFISSTFKFAPKFKFLNKILTLVIIIMSIGLLTRAAININAAGFYRYFTSSSTFIKDNYVDPNDVKLTFPKKKRNLIYIFVESLESTSIDKAQGGQMSTNLLPKLTALAKTGIHFSDSSKEFGGAHQFYGTGWTVAGMVAQTAGIPLKVPVQGNTYANSKSDAFLPGVTSINDILANEGYAQEILMGSDATFGGRRSYFSQHGKVTIDDWLQAQKDRRIPKNYKVWWGYEDSKLMTFAKEDLTKLASGSNPFNFTMLTANTHHIGGYVEKDMPRTYSDQYSNVIAFTDTQLVELVTWIQQQDFYKNTTVIIQGDHLSMDAAYYKRIDTSKRHTFNLILNAPVDTNKVKTKNRDFGTFDLFPTTLAALNVKIQGNRLGLGTNLLSSKKTLAEKYSVDKVDSELSQGSVFYNDKFLFDK